MNFKNTKDIIIRVVKDFLGVTAVGGMFMLICLMFFAESIVFSKEVMAFLIGMTTLGIGIGGLVSAIFIFFIICTKKISKLEKTIAEKDKVIDIQNAQLRDARASSRKCYTHTSLKSTTSSNPASRNILKEIEPLSEEVSIDEDSELAVCETSEQEPTLPEENKTEENA